MMGGSAKVSQPDPYERAGNGSSLIRFSRTNGSSGSIFKVRSRLPAAVLSTDELERCQATSTPRNRSTTVRLYRLLRAV